MLDTSMSTVSAVLSKAVPKLPWPYRQFKAMTNARAVACDPHALTDKNSADRAGQMSGLGSFAWQTGRSSMGAQSGMSPPERRNV